MRPPMGMIPPMGPMAGGNSGEAGGFPDGGEGGAGQPGGGRVAQGLSTQLTPGVTWLGAVENVKELGEVIGTLPVDVIFVFDVKVRPATASTWVNNDTRLRVVSAAKVTEALFTSGTINNKGVMEARKRRGPRIRSIRKSPRRSRWWRTVMVLYRATSSTPCRR